ncbi:hypothetical protein NECAME_18102, partial [Necator americanus]
AGKAQWAKMAVTATTVVTLMLKRTLSCHVKNAHRHHRDRQDILEIRDQEDEQELLARMEVQQNLVELDHLGHRAFVDLPVNTAHKDHLVTPGRCLTAPLKDHQEDQV